jgi:hypothetical protein
MGRVKNKMCQREIGRIVGNDCGECEEMQKCLIEYLQHKCGEDGCFLRKLGLSELKELAEGAGLL